MKLILHNKEFNEEMFCKIAEAYNQVCQNEYERVDIYLSSDGGFVSISEAILSLINSDAERFSIVAYNKIKSCAFSFFIKANCPKVLLENTTGMYHKGYWDISINDKGKTIYESENFNLKQAREVEYPQDLKFIKQCQFNNKETKKFIQGKDVYFSYHRLLEITANYDKN